MTPDHEPKIDVILRGYSLDTDEGLAGFCMVTLVEGFNDQGEKKRILVDPAHVGRRVLLWNALAQRGLKPSDIDAVVLTHAHWDHIQNIDVFDRSPLLIHPAERAYSLKPHHNDWATPAWTGAIIERQPVFEVAGGDRLLQGVRVVDLPGHTPGSIGLAVENAAGMSVISGDALHHAKFAVAEFNPLIFWDPDQAAESIRQAVDMADFIYPGHDRVFRITKNKEIEYQEPFHMTLSNVASGLEELGFERPEAKQWVMPDLEEQHQALAAYRQAAEERKSRLVGLPEDGCLPWWEVEQQGNRR